MRVTLKEIANEAGVSIYTVSRVLNGKNKEAYQPAAERAERIRQVARRMGFVPNASARSMRRSGTKVVGVLVPENPITSLVDYETILGLNEGLEAQGYVLALTRSSDVTQEADQADGAQRPRRKRGAAREEAPTQAPPHPSRVFQERMLDGMAVLGPIPPAMCELVERITPSCLWMDTNVDRKRNCLRRDERHAGQMVVRRLVDRGYRKLVYVTPRYEETGPHYSFDDRAEGATAEAAACGVELVHRPVALLDASTEDAIAPMASWLRPDVAIIAATDRTALALLVQLSRHGLRPGVDCGMAACDRTNHTQTHWPGLSCVDVRRYGLGQKAAEMMVAILRNPKHVCPSQTVRWAWHEGDTAPPVRATPARQ